MTPDGEEPPGGTPVEDGEIKREHGGVRNADGAGDHPVSYALMIGSLGSTRDMSSGSLVITA